MPTVSQGSSQTINLGATDSYKVTIADGGDAYVDLLSGAPGSPYQSPRLRGPTTTKTFGPYGVPATVRVRSIVGATTYEQIGQLLTLRQDSLTKKLYNSSGEVVEAGGAPITITGTVAVGQSLTAVPATGWTITGGQWYRDAAAIIGATALVYAVQAADAGTTVSFVPTGLPFKAVAGAVPAAPPLRAVATNTNFPTNYSTGYQRMGTRRYHKIQVPINGIALRLVNSYVDPTTLTEMTPGAATTFRTSLEKGGVNLGQFTLAGNTSMVVADGGQADTDILPVNLVPGDIVMEREERTNAVGLPYEGNAVSGTRPNYNDAANGEACYVGAGFPDIVGGVGALTGGTNVPSAMGGAFCLIGYHNGVAVCVFGDSIEEGIGETFSGTNGRGIVHVAMSAMGLPVGKVARGGDAAVKVVASNAKRRAAIGTLFTHVIGNHVFNDKINFAQSDAQLKANIETIASWFPTMKVDWRTPSGYSTSSDSFATTAGQTPASTSANITSAATMMRAGLTGVRKLHETGDVMQTARNSNIWPADGVIGNRRTADGIHPTRILGDTVQASGVFSLADFAAT